MTTNAAPSFIDVVERSPWWRRAPVLWALAAFLAFTVVVLTRSASLLEPDDFAYRASIVALSRGEILLSNAHYLAVKASLSTSGGFGIAQWHHLSSGSWISEKNPGYPFLAVVFYALGLLRLTPLFFGAIACLSLFVAMRRWVGERAGALAVWLYCFSGAALTFAWRATMPSFSDASLVATGMALLVWTLLASDHTSRRRRWVGLAAFVALELAVVVRYTNLLELAVAVAAVVLLARRAALGLRTLALWGASVLVTGAVVLGFDQWAYGSATSTGYSSGEISFSRGSVWANLKGMPAQLTAAMPLWLLAGAALVVLLVRHLRRRSTAARVGVDDASIGAMLGAGWLGLWGLYLCYTWTASQLHGGPAGHTITVHVIRFYLPALGLLAMLGAWLLARAPRWLGVLITSLLIVAALFSFNAMASTSGTGANVGSGGLGGPSGVGNSGLKGHQSAPSSGPGGSGQGPGPGARPAPGVPPSP